MATDPSSTTFVQADPSNFRDVVQRLTGATTQYPPSPQPQPPPTPAPPQHSLLRLHQRRQAMRRNNNNNSAARRAVQQPRTTPAHDINNNNHDYYYQNMLQSFNSTCSTSSGSSASAFVQLSPVSPLEVMQPQQGFTSGRGVRVRNTTSTGGGVVSSWTEERVIAEKGFYLHPATPKENEPRLLPLFPLHSPSVEDDDDD